MTPAGTPATRIPGLTVRPGWSLEVPQQPELPGPANTQPLEFATVILASVSAAEPPIMVNPPMGWPCEKEAAEPVKSPITVTMRMALTPVVLMAAPPAGESAISGLTMVTPDIPDPPPALLLSESSTKGYLEASNSTSAILTSVTGAEFP